MDTLTKNTNLETKEVEDKSELQEKAHLEGMLHSIDEQNAKLGEGMRELLELRHRLFNLTNSEFDASTNVEDQLYDEDSYNGELTQPDLSLRAPGTLFDDKREVYDPKPEDTEEIAEIKEQYREMILKVALENGFVEIGHESENEIDKRLGIIESNMEKIEGPVEAVIVAGGAGLSNPMRLRGGLREIESGKVDTDQIIVTACERKTSDAEKSKLEKAGFRTGETELEACIKAAEDVLGIKVDLANTRKIPVPYDNDATADAIETEATVGDRIVKISFVSAPPQSGRKFYDGRVADRPNTAETFLATDSLIDKNGGKMVVVSHDTFNQYQGIVAEEIFGLTWNMDTIATGPFRSDRVFKKPDGSYDILQAENVVDEIAKVYKDRALFRVKIENKLKTLEQSSN